MKIYDTSIPEDLAKLQPNEYYWIDSWHGRPARIVFICMTKRGRLVSCGNEYTDFLLAERVQQDLEYGDKPPKFYGPIPTPNFDKE